MEVRQAAKTFVTLFVLCVGIFGVGHFVRAATLYVNPTAGTYDIGQTFSATVSVSSADQAMNAAQGTITFPIDLLEVTGISTSNSITSLWVQQPTFSNTAGTVHFEGVVLNPGFTGTNGHLLTITFRPKSQGTATVSFSTGSVLANDGKGTNISTGLSKSIYTLNPQNVAPPVAESTTPVETVGAPAAPPVTSSTHPDPYKWYSANTASFAWTLPADATGVAVLMDNRPNTNPVTSLGLVRTYATKTLADGVWYFHVRVKNAAGWGGISHFRVQIDTTKPDRFDVTELPRENASDPHAHLKFDAHDATSGVEHYEIRIDGGNAENWTDDGSHTYTTTPIPPGAHVLLLRAVDQAGNSAANSAEITIEAIAAPVITSIPTTSHAGEPVTIGGTTFPNTLVTVWVQRENGRPESAQGQSDVEGNFTILYDLTLDPGVYKVWAQATDERGAQSLPSDRHSVVVQQSTVEEIGQLAIRFLITVVILLGLIILIGWMLWFIWAKCKRFFALLKKETAETEEHVQNVQDILKHDKSATTLKQHIKESEDFLEKEVEEIKAQMAHAPKKPHAVKK